MDSALRLQLLRASVRDRHFLNKAWRDVNPKDFEDREESVIIQAAVEYWDKYKEPIGPMLFSEAFDLAKERHFGADSRKKLKHLIKAVQSGQIENVSVRALTDRVHALKMARFNDDAINEILDLHDKGELNAAAFRDIVQRAVRELSRDGVTTSKILSPREQKKRTLRRMKGEKQYPLLLIDPIDEKIKAIGRGHLGLFLAPYKGGKGLALIWIAIAYALQGLNVLFISLEDGLDIVEDRFDSAITGIPMKKLRQLPKRLRRKFLKMRKLIRGRIHVVDGTEGGWSVPRMEKAWEQLRQEGFTADAIVADYDDEIEVEQKFKGESARRFEFALMYRQMRQAAARLNVIWWTAAQANKKAETKKWITGQDAAEDISKIRKAFLSIGIGRDQDEEHVKGLYVIAHKLDRSRFGVEIVGDEESAIFYDRESTLARRRRNRKK